jgi:hypothetical protein
MLQVIFYGYRPPHISDIKEAVKEVVPTAEFINSVSKKYDSRPTAYIKLMLPMDMPKSTVKATINAIRKFIPKCHLELQLQLEVI